MSEMKHTKGPWVIHESNAIVGEKLDDHPIWLRPVIARFATGVRPADARLMAAAPELLEALQITRGNIASLGPAGALTPYTSYQEWLAMVDAAIAKATGGKP
jgi:hypothetical protein